MSTAWRYDVKEPCWNKVYVTKGRIRHRLTEGLKNNGNVMMNISTLNITRGEHMMGLREGNAACLPPSSGRPARQAPTQGPLQLAPLFTLLWPPDL